MFGLAYASNATTKFDMVALRELEQKAIEKNERLDITGYLCFNHGNFFQYLEGSEQTVLELMQTIGEDDRHEVVNIVHVGNVGPRLFPSWRMRLLDSQAVKTVQMEHVLESVLLNMQEDLFGAEKVRGQVMKLVKLIAENQSRFVQV